MRFEVHVLYLDLEIGIFVAMLRALVPGYPAIILEIRLNLLILLSNVLINEIMEQKAPYSAQEQVDGESAQITCHRLTPVLVPNRPWIPH
jgi:hypothetical protein